MITAVLLALSVAYEPTPCWEVSGARLSNPSIAAGYSYSWELGTGRLKIKCLGGNINSAGGTPEWSAYIMSGKYEYADATHLINASSPYPIQVYNPPENDTWHLQVNNLNNVRSIFVNITIEYEVLPYPISTPSPTVGPEYEDATSRVALYYAAAAYVPPEDLSPWQVSNSCLAATTSNFTVIDVFDGRNNTIYTPFAFVGVDHLRKWIVVSFKGTNGTSDAVADLIQIFSGALYYQHDCKINEHISGRTHSGFCINYQELAALSIKEKTLEVMGQYSDYPVLMTGHSLGGALCTLFAVDLVTTLEVENPAWLQRLVMYTFGQPRVGDGALAPNLPYLFRVTHSSDIIVHLVGCCSSNSACYYAISCPHHGALEVWYPNTNMTPDSYRICDTSGEDNTCSNSRVPSLSITDHLYYFNVQVGSICYPEEDQAY
eukprot:TRINITY_DN1371_c1_g3_i2.p1 TRINITY_DN1371_c1_g3~~TRINITY_DN1371_c1_g3_i2.p1  ORF type:complete len:449 (+),score=42.66 TRINITY_DN1371_c1_g3_i2:53-1348(+)